MHFKQYKSFPNKIEKISSFIYLNIQKITKQKNDT